MKDLKEQLNNESGEQPRELLSWDMISSILSQGSDEERCPIVLL